MLNVRDHHWLATGIEIVLLNAVVVAKREQSRSSAIAADCCNILGCGYCFVRYSLRADVPCASLSSVCISIGSCTSGCRWYVPLSVLHNAPIL